MRFVDSGAGGPHEDTCRAVRFDHFAFVMGSLDPPGGGAGGGFKVDSEFLLGTIRPLLEALTVADEIWRDDGQIASGIERCGSDPITNNVNRFMHDWGHAMGLVVKQGSAVAAALERIVAGYRLAELQAAERFAAGPSASAEGGQQSTPAATEPIPPPAK